MTAIETISRRSILASLALSPALASPTLSNEASCGAGLLLLGRQFDVFAAQIDHAIEHGFDIEQDLLDHFCRIEGEIVATPAVTIDGLRVKARAACWALLDDLDSGDQSTTDKRMALSIVRDLIRHYDPGLERPGALKKLVEDIESGAGNSVNA
jgi:hypothetical protein